MLPGGLTEREGAAAATRLFQSGPLPTAVFAFNDRCALGVLDVFIRAGVRVPDDVSVVGFDDSPLAGLAHVNLTTVGQDSARLAELAVARAVERLDGSVAGHVEKSVSRSLWYADRPLGPADPQRGRIDVIAA